MSLSTDDPAFLADETLRALVQGRYRRAEPVGGIRASPVLETLLAHRSVRAYLPTPIPPGTLEAVVAAAQSAPTSSNLQAWSVVAVQDSARRTRLAGLAANQRHIIEAPLFLVWLADLSRLRRIAQRAGRPADGLDYMESFLLAAIDAALAAQNAVVALESLGLGTCYIGAIRNRPVEVAAELDLPKEAVAVFGLTVGYPDPSRPADVKPRLPQRVVLHLERYDHALPTEQLDAYDRTLRGFQAEQRLPAVDWTEQAALRIGGAASLSGRDRLADSLRALGFVLK